MVPTRQPSLPDAFARSHRVADSVTSSTVTFAVARKRALGGPSSRHDRDMTSRWSARAWRWRAASPTRRRGG